MEWASEPMNSWRTWCHTRTKFLRRVRTASGTGNWQLATTFCGNGNGGGPRADRAGHLACDTGRRAVTVLYYPSLLTYFFLLAFATTLGASHPPALCYANWMRANFLHGPESIVHDLPYGDIALRKNLALSAKWELVGRGAS